MVFIVLNYFLYISNTHEYLAAAVNYDCIYHPLRSISIFKFSYSQAGHSHYIDHYYFLIAGISIRRYGFVYIYILRKQYRPVGHFLFG